MGAGAFCASLFRRFLRDNKATIIAVPSAANERPSLGTKGPNGIILAVESQLRMLDAAASDGVGHGD